MRTFPQITVAPSSRQQLHDRAASVGGQITLCVYRLLAQIKLYLGRPECSCILMAADIIGAQ